MPRVSIKQIIPMYDTIYDLPVILVCGEGEEVNDDEFLQHLFIPTCVMEPSIKNPQALMHSINHSTCEDFQGFIINDIPNRRLVLEKFQLSLRAGRLAIYSLFDILSCTKAPTFKALFVNPPTLEEAAIASEYKNVLYYEFKSNEIEIE